MTYHERATRILKICSRGKSWKENILAIEEELRALVEDSRERASFDVTNWDD
jgi:hypothetical protein